MEDYLKWLRGLVMSGMENFSTDDLIKQLELFQKGPGGADVLYSQIKTKLVVMLDRFAHKKTKLELEQTQYAAICSVLSDLKHKKKTEKWFYENVVVTGQITAEFYEELEKLSKQKEGLLPFENAIISLDAAQGQYQFRFDGNKVFCLIAEGVEKEIEPSLLLNDYNPGSTKSLSSFGQLLLSKNLLTENLIDASVLEKADFISSGASISRTYLVNKARNKFFVQKDKKNEEINPADFIDAFKKQYREERPWYAKALGFFGIEVGTLRVLKKQKSHADKLKYLLDHAKENPKSTTAKALETVFSSVEYGGGEAASLAPGPKKQVSSVSSSARSEENVNVEDITDIDRLLSAYKDKNLFSWETKESLEAVAPGSVYQPSMLDGENQSHINSSSTSIAGSSRGCAYSPSSSGSSLIQDEFRGNTLNSSLTVDQQRRDSRSASVLSSSSKFLSPPSPEETARTEQKHFEAKQLRLENEKQVIRDQLSTDLEVAFLPVWVALKADERNFVDNEDSYGEPVRYIDLGFQSQLFTRSYKLIFNEDRVKELQSLVGDDLKICDQFYWLQQMRALYSEFDSIRNLVVSSSSDQAVVIPKMQAFTEILNRLTDKGVLKPEVSENVTKAVGHYIVASEKLENTTPVTSGRSVCTM